MFDLKARLSILSLAILTNGLEWPGVKPTPVDHGLALLGWTPKPTEAPYEHGLRIRGRMPGHELFARQEDPLTVCGYISGIRSSSVTCPGGRSCFFNSPISAAGCCYKSSDSPASCGQYTSCVPMTEISACTGACASDLLVVKCSLTAAPNCFTFAFTGYNNIGCLASAGSQNVQWSYEGQTDSVISTIEPSQVQTRVIFITSRDPSNPTLASETNPSNPTLAFETNPAEANDKSKGGSSLNIGAIAGGAVGGFAILAIFVLALVWLLRRNKKNKQPETATAAGGQPADFDGQNYDAGGYDPNVHQQVPLQPAPQYNPGPTYYEPGAAAIPLKYEYSQQPPQPDNSQPPVAAQGPPVGYNELSSTASPPTQPQHMQPQSAPGQHIPPQHSGGQYVPPQHNGPIYEAPTSQR